MLTRIRIRDLKKLQDVDIELGQSVVLIGPNNSGKSTALQALALWDVGLRRWNEKASRSPKRKSGVAVNRRDLMAIPVPNANLLWRDLHVRSLDRSEGAPQTRHILIEIIVDGVTSDKEWSCGLEFDYSNPESFYCRALRLGEGTKPKRMPIPPEAGRVSVAFLPPMSGLAAVEPKWEPGRINVLLGEGQTAQVLRNMCYQIHESNREAWQELVRHIDTLFGATLQPPEYIQERGEITMAYKEHGATALDISSAGRGLQQTLLLLAHLYTSKPKTVLLLDEPDAHLEVLRQRQIYQLITELAGKQGSQIIAASHSEVVLNEAADKDVVVAFVGAPHRIDGRSGQVAKALKEIPYDQYYLAEQTGWVLYLEGSTDLSILQAFAEILGHEAAKRALERPFVHYVLNQPTNARNHFLGLREACPELVGIALFDRIGPEKLQKLPHLKEIMWEKRELENYLCMEEVLLAYARHNQPNDLFGRAEADRRVEAMRESITEVTKALETLGDPSPWSPDVKGSDVLNRVFRLYFRKVDLPNLLYKSSYHVLARLVPKDKIDPEIMEKLDAIVEVAGRAKPRE